MKAQILVLMLFVACTNTKNNRSNVSYPLKIESLKLQDLFDDIKWRLYCIYSDDTINYVNSKGEHLTLGMLNLTYIDCFKQEDTVTILFDFDTNNIHLISGFKDTLDRLSVKYLYDGGIFIKNRLIGYSAHTFNGYYQIPDTIRNSRDRRITPLQPEVISYIKENRDKINPWFREEAIKRGVLQK